MKTAKFYKQIRANLRSLILIILSPLFFLLTSFDHNHNHVTAKHKADYINITVQDSRRQSGDTLTLILFDVIQCYDKLQHNNGSYDAIGRDGKFTFHIPVRQVCGYFELIANRKTTKTGGGNDKRSVINTCFWETGDNIIINLVDKETAGGVYSKYSFSGKGALKYQLAHMIDSIMESIIVQSKRPMFDSAYNYYDLRTERFGRVLPIIEQNKRHLSNLAYQVLKANVLFSGGRSSFFSIRDYYDKSIKDATSTVKNKFRRELNKAFANDNPYGIRENGLLNSQQFLLYTFFKYSTLAYINYDHIDGKLAFEMEKRHLTGFVRDKQLLFLLMNYFPSSPSQGELYKEARPIVREKNSVTALHELMRTQPGKPFPGFDFQDTTGKLISFSQFRGKTVFIDFWNYGCGGCAKLYQEALKNAEKTFKNDPGVTFVSVNVDRGKSRWIKGIESGIYTSDDVVNLNTNGLGAFHPFLLSYQIYSIPFAMLIDKNGIIRYCDSNNLYNYTALVKTIDGVK